MASAAQIAANRRNALRSTGPRTAAGKARSCLNARKHGLYARDQSPSAEEAEQIDRLTECYRRRLRPQDAIEEGLIRRLALTQFQLSRISILEAALLNSAIAKARGRYEDLPLAIGQALIDCCGSLEKLSRYESSLARNLGHTLQTLLARHRRRQAPGEQKSDGTNPIDSVSSGPQPLMKSIACAPRSQACQGGRTIAGDDMPPGEGATMVHNRVGSAHRQKHDHDLSSPRRYRSILRVLGGLPIRPTSQSRRRSCQRVDSRWSRRAAGRDLAPF